METIENSQKFTIQEQRQIVNKIVKDLEKDIIEEYGSRVEEMAFNIQTEVIDALKNPKEN